MWSNPVALQQQCLTFDCTNAPKRRNTFGTLTGQDVSFCRTDDDTTGTICPVYRKT